MLHIVLPRALEVEEREPQDCLEEMAHLVRSSDLGLGVVERRVINLRRTYAQTFIGKGSLEVLGSLIEEMGIEALCLDASISAVQQRNLEKILSCEVIDRISLILNIFAANAKSQEGRLQVSRAECAWQRSRLAKAWQHLERQRGGKGFLAGPGERQIELDRRMIDKTAKVLDRKLEKLNRNRGLQRRARRNCHLIALTGYTNSGKSTLFNKLLALPEASRQDTRQQPFLTLDTKIKRLRDASQSCERTLLLADTVGFIARLPHFLIDAFTATLEEVVQAQTILHVRDISASNSAEQKLEVLRVLERLGCRGRIIEVWNKIDALTLNGRGAVLRSADFYGAYAISALTGEGCEGLRARVEAVDSQ